MQVKTGIGQDSHRFLPEESTKPCIMAGLVFDDVPGFKANSDGDIIFHAICNAISSISGVTILGDLADELLEKDGITDSEVYLIEGLKTLGEFHISHVAVTIEAKRPILLPFIPKMRANIARVLELDTSQVGLTATTGEGLTDFGCGLGAQCFAIVTVQKS